MSPGKFLNFALLAEIEFGSSLDGNYKVVKFVVGGSTHPPGSVPAYQHILSCNIVLRLNGLII